MRAGLLSGRDVCGDRLSEVLWYPSGRYALFPLYIPGKPDIPCEHPPISTFLNLAWLGACALKARAPEARLPFPWVSPRRREENFRGRKNHKARG
jgi:hypothetical protein